MRILFAGDEHPYSAYALKEASKLAMNTWADVTIVGVYPALPTRNGDSPIPPDHPLSTAMRRYREEFLADCGDGPSPYAQDKLDYEWVPLRSGAWEDMKLCRGCMKDLKVRLRLGNAANEILSESKLEGTDLIVIGTTTGDRCVWEESAAVPQKVVNDADCSVLLVKENRPIDRILAFIDQASVSQESLEMINQMVTIHGARLELVGVTRAGAAKPEAYRKLIEVGDYYGDKNIQVKTRLADKPELEKSLAKNTDQDLVAFWMGKKSLLGKLFPKDWVGRFVSTCQSSVLVLR